MGLPAWRDRVEDGEREIEEAGGKLVGVWVTLGRYDVVEDPHVRVAKSHRERSACVGSALLRLDERNRCVAEPA